MNETIEMKKLLKPSIANVLGATESRPTGRIETGGITYWFDIVKLDCIGVRFIFFLGGFWC